MWTFRISSNGGISYRTVNFTSGVWAAVFHGCSRVLWGQFLCADRRCFVPFCSNLLFLPSPLIRALGEFLGFQNTVSTPVQDEVLTPSCSAAAAPGFSDHLGFPEKKGARGSMHHVHHLFPTANAGWKLPL